MKNQKKTRIGCVGAIVFFLLIVISSTLYYRNARQKASPPKDTITWIDAVEKCKRKYEAYTSVGQIKAPNCRKRSEDDEFFYFSWSKPLAIIVRKSNGVLKKSAAKCQVAKADGEIVYMTLDKSVLVSRSKKQK